MSKTKRISGTREWASATLNCFSGCENNCLYCYAQSRKIQYKQLTVENKHIPVKRKWEAVIGEIKSIQKKFNGTAKIMFPSTHDITPATVDYCLDTLKYMLSYPGANNGILIVSKPNLGCIQRLCTELNGYKDRIMFRFTIGSADDAVLKYWEPGASSFSERVESLKYACKQGFSTSVSCEPMLDGNIRAVIDAVNPFVTDSIWLGAANQFKSRIKWNGNSSGEVMEKADKLLAIFSKERIDSLYAEWKDDPKIRWKDEIKKILGIPTNESVGMDR